MVKKKFGFQARAHTIFLPWPNHSFITDLTLLALYHLYLVKDVETNQPFLLLLGQIF